MTRNSSRAVLALTGAALFMIVLDNLIVASALPSIERGLDAPINSAEWVLDAYILSFAVLILTGSALGERFGRRKVFIIGLAIFTAASAAGALVGQHRRAGGGARGAGSRQRDPHAADAHPPVERLPAREARRRARHLVVDRRPRRGGRTARRRDPDQHAVVALDLLGQRAGGHRARSC